MEFAGRFQGADHLAALGHAIGSVGTFVLGVTALAVAITLGRGRFIASGMHHLHAVRHVGGTLHACHGGMIHRLRALLMELRSSGMRGSPRRTYWRRGQGQRDQQGK